ncbi:unnamed protein product [Owenia fusiformis]|uniref:Uncharacterized protein n=1 Tax=Owenia fusiformis TaxID=6347 RepID=A0A8S4NDR8_OWEFU|nr:unnamed protein product [Owenia fusiformis]
MKVHSIILVMLNIYDVVHTATPEDSCLLFREDQSDFKREVNLKIQLLDDKISKVLDILGEVTWGDWGEWSACDMSVCNIAHRERPCLGEDGYKSDPSRCSRLGGDHIETKQCCDIDVAKAYKRMYSGKGSVPDYIIEAIGSNIKVNEREDLSWAVSLKFKRFGASNYKHICGGVILTNIWVLTAAHCITETKCWDNTEKKIICDMDHWTVTAGEWELDKTRSEEQIRGLEHIVIHKNYSVDYSREIEYIHDIALIRLNSTLSFMSNPFVQPSLLPARTCIEAMGNECSQTHQDWALRTDCFTTGWGIGKNQQVTNKGNTIGVLIDENENYEIIRSSKIYEEKKIICKGFSGSPMMCDINNSMMVNHLPNQKKVVLGLNSYIYPSGCTSAHKNYVQTSIDYHLQWISHTVMDWIQWGQWSTCFKNKKRYRLRSGFFPEYGYLPGHGPLYQSYQGDVLRGEEQTCTEINVDKCHSEPCKNEGTCIDKGNSYKCRCKTGYTGVNCQTGIDKCLSNPCKNEGTCVDRRNNYKCRCKAGYTGINCQTDINECEQSPCQNEGTCVDKVNSYTCNCKAGYAGINCQTDINECEPNPCQNEGTCVDKVNTYTCNCIAGYTGINCETDINDCEPNPCQNEGTCVDSVDSYTCNCKAGYTGINCQTDINDCEPNPCQNEGTCVDSVDSYTCNCKAGYTGINCQTDINECEQSPCQNEGTCVDKVNSYTCTCKAGYTGNNCQTDINECEPNPCQNEGTCVDKVNTYTCNCKAGYAGINCQTVINQCEPNPCQNEGTCVDKVDSYTCNCIAGYTGINCQTDINECGPNPCQNEGTCVDKVNSYTCNCKVGYSGINCQTDINECKPNPCHNEGTCVDKVNSYTCNCKAGYSGINCQTDINECEPNPCHNEGTCVDKVNSYTCNCKAGYSGINCQTVTDINACESNPCQNEGTCVATVDSYTCRCNGAFTGTNCQTMSCGVDIVVIIDISCRVITERKLAVNSFMESFVAALDIGPGDDKVQLGLMTFDSTTYSNFYLSRYKNSADVVQALSFVDMHYDNKFRPRCGSRIDLALRNARLTYFTPAHGVRDTLRLRNPPIQNVVLVITYGAILPSSRVAITKMEAERLKTESFANVFVVNLPDSANTNGTVEFSDIVSEPSSKFLMNIGFDELLDSLGTILLKICDI